MDDERFLRYRPGRPPKGGRPVLWPVHVAKVLYPVPGDRPLNVFEEAVLGLARARCADDVEAAGLLCLDVTLVAHIRSQLRSKRLVDRAGAPTARGLEALADLEDGLSELKVGYAFQDAIGGEWLPRFEEDLPEIEADGREGGSPYFVFSRETAEKHWPMVVPHRLPPSADPAALLRSCAAYKIDHFHARQRDDWENIPKRLDVRDLSFLDDTPQPMWVWTWVYRGPSGGQPWLVSDPFGLQGAAAWLRKPLEAALKKDDSLARLVAKASGMPQSVSLSAAEWLAGLETAADLAVMAEYPFTERVPRIQERLAALLRKRALVDSQRHPQPEDVRSLMNESQILAETVLQWLLETYPMEVRLRNQEAWGNSSEAILKGLGIPCLDTRTARQLAKQPLREICYALERGTSSLKALLAAALLTTANHREHPLLRLSEREAGLGRLLELANARNRKGSHAGLQDATKGEALEHAETALGWVRAFKDWY